MAAPTRALTAEPTHPPGTWRLDLGGIVKHATDATLFKHMLLGLTVGQCKARCTDGKTWPGCRGFEYHDLMQSCTWASESSQLKSNKQFGSTYTLYTRTVRTTRNT